MRLFPREMTNISMLDLRRNVKNGLCAVNKNDFYVIKSAKIGNKRMRKFTTMKLHKTVTVKKTNKRRMLL